MKRLNYLQTRKKKNNLMWKFQVAIYSSFENNPFRVRFW